MAEIKITFNGKPGIETSFGDSLQDLVLIRAIEILQAKVLEAITPQEADLIALHFTGDSPETLSFRVEGPGHIARKAFTAMTRRGRQATPHL
jgi:hypothetical protein